MYIGGYKSVYLSVGYKFDPAVSLRQQHLITNLYTTTCYIQHQTAWDCLIREMELL